jgi:hypothetical protein
LLKLLHKSLVAGSGWRQDFDRNIAVQPGIKALVNHIFALMDQLNQLVLADRLAQ